MAAFLQERKMHSPIASTTSAKRLSLLRRGAWLCAALVLVVISLSAFLRQSNAGLGCTPWPACHGRAALGESPPEAAGPAQRGARAVHRVTASSLLVLLLGMTALAWIPRPRADSEGRQILLALGLVLFLAVLGPFTSGSRVPAVTLGNLLGGLVLFAVCVRLALRPSPRQAPTGPPLGRWAWAALVLLLLQMALGGLISAGYAGLSCPQLLGCRPAAESWQALDPRQVPGAGAGLPQYAGGVGAQWLHRLGALAVLAAVLALALVAWRAGRRKAATALAALVALQTEVGIVLALGSLPLGVALAHNLLAALLLAAVATLLPRTRALSPGL